MEHLLLLGLVVLLIMVGVNVILVVMLARRLQEPGRKTPDPQLERLAQLKAETAKRRRESLARFGSIREVLQKNLKGA